MTSNTIELNLGKRIEDLDVKTKNKMIFIYNALEDGWNIKKMNNSYIFTKKHLGKQEIFQDDFLTNFISEGLNIDKICNK
jgi:hypothetical protein